MNRRCLLFVFFFLLIFMFFFFRESKTVILEEGVHEFPQGIKILEDEVLIIRPGAILQMGEGSRIEIYGKIVAKGTEDKRIVFQGKNGAYWRGIKINGNNEVLDIDNYKKLLREKKFESSNYFDLIADGHFFTYCNFENLMTDGKEIRENRVKSTIEAKDTAITVSNCIFSDIIHMGCVQPENSLALIANNYTDSYSVMKVFFFISSVHITYGNELVPHRNEWHTWAEGIYSKASVAIISENLIEGFTDNGIDNDYSLSYIFNNRIKDVHDQGIDIDNHTEAYVFGNEIESAGTAGILVSNQSKAVLFRNVIKGTSPGLSLRNGAYVIVEDLKIEDGKIGIKIFNQVPLFICKDDWEKIKKQFGDLSEEDYKHYGYYIIKDGSEAIELLENSYDEYEEFYVFRNITVLHDLKNLFKTIDLSTLKDITEVSEKRDSIKHLSRYHNAVSLSDVKLDVEKPILKSSFFSIKGSYFDRYGEKVSVDSQKMLLGGGIDFEDSNQDIVSLIDMVKYLDNLIQKTEKIKNGL